MAEFTPWVLAAPRSSTSKKTRTIYERDVYNFSSYSVSSFPNPVVQIPACGPNAAGAVNPTSARTVERIEIIAAKSGAPIYGINTQRR